MASLPKLPIPPLEGAVVSLSAHGNPPTDRFAAPETCQRYLAALKPLQTAAEHAATEAVVARFLASDGPRLQAQLVAYAAERPSYIQEFWYEAYLHHTSSVVLNLNPFFILE